MSTENTPGADDRERIEKNLPSPALSGETAVEPASSATERQLQLIESITGDAYVEHVKHFTRWVRSEAISLNAAAVQKYFATLNASSYAANTKIVRRQAVKKRLRQLFRAGGLGSTVSANLEQFLSDLDREPETKSPKVASKSVASSKYLTSDEYRACLGACGSERQRMFFILLWETGLRVSELCAIRIEDARAEEHIVAVRVRGKGSKERQVRMRLELWDRARAVFSGTHYLAETTGGKPYSRHYVSSEIAKVSERALARRYRAHTLRHSFATRMIERTRKVQAVSEYLGHASPAVTLAMYTHEELDDGELFG